MQFDARFIILLNILTINPITDISNKHNKNQYPIEPRTKYIIPNENIHGISNRIIFFLRNEQKFTHSYVLYDK